MATRRATGDVREEGGTLGSGSASHVDGLTLPLLPAHRTISHLQKECGHPFREPLQFIVITVMSVIRGTFPDTNGVFYVTINSWRVRGPSRDRHVHRH
jgi:hypothetical protein